MQCGSHLLFFATFFSDITILDKQYHSAVDFGLKNYVLVSYSLFFSELIAFPAGGIAAIVIVSIVAMMLCVKIVCVLTGWENKFPELDSMEDDEQSILPRQASNASEPTSPIFGPDALATSCMGATASAATASGAGAGVIANENAIGMLDLLPATVPSVSQPILPILYFCSSIMNVCHIHYHFVTSIGNPNPNSSLSLTPTQYSSPQSPHICPVEI